MLNTTEQHMYEEPDIYIRHSKQDRLPEDQGGLTLFGEQKQPVRYTQKKRAHYCRRSPNAPIVDATVRNCIMNQMTTK